MNKKVIRMTENDLHNIVKESVGKIINEIGDTPKGQRALGALSMRHALRNPNYDARDTKSKEAKIYDYAKKARGEENGEKWDYANRKWDNPLHTEYEKGGTDYLNSHTDELAAAHRRAGMRENRMTENIDEAYGTLPNSSKEVVSKLRNDSPENPYKPLNTDVVKGEGNREDRIRVAINTIAVTVGELAQQIEDFGRANDMSYGRYGGKIGDMKFNNNSRMANMDNFVGQMRDSVSHLRKVIRMAKDKLIMNAGDQPGKVFDKSSNKFIGNYDQY